MIADLFSVPGSAAMNTNVQMYENGVMITFGDIAAHGPQLPVTTKDFTPKPRS